MRGSLTPPPPSRPAPPPPPPHRKRSLPAPDPPHHRDQAGALPQAGRAVPVRGSAAPHLRPRLLPSVALVFSTSYSRRRRHRQRRREPRLARCEGVRGLLLPRLGGRAAALQARAWGGVPHAARGPPLREGCPRRGRRRGRGRGARRKCREARKRRRRRYAGRLTDPALRGVQRPRGRGQRGRQGAGEAGEAGGRLRGEAAEDWEDEKRRRLRVRAVRVAGGAGGRPGGLGWSARRALSNQDNRMCLLLFFCCATSRTTRPIGIA